MEKLPIDPKRVSLQAWTEETPPVYGKYNEPFSNRRDKEGDPAHSDEHSRG